MHHSMRPTHVAAPVAMVIVALLCSLAAGPLRAQPPVEALGRCLADNTSGKDRKDLARWLFAAMTAHPEMKPLSAAGPEAIDAASRTAAAIFTRLLADTCAKEIRAAVQSGGPAALQSGFQVLGQLAMQELMTNPDVGAAMAVLDRHIDKAKVDAALQGR
jgi:hypothetical protein